jgi:Holliday junction resolvase
MSASNYRSGADLERAASHVLTDAGYQVIRSAGSKKVIDVLAFRPGSVLLIQAKTNGYAPQAELRELHQLAATMELASPMSTWMYPAGGWRPLLVSWHKEGRAARTVRFREVFLQLDGKFRAAAEWKPEVGQ